MYYNRVRVDRQAQIVEKILDPLQELLLPGGEVSLVESSIYELNKRLRNDVREKLGVHEQHGVMTHDTIVKIQNLSKRLNKILAEMEADISWNRSRDRLKKMKEDQERLRDMVSGDYTRALKEFFDSISGTKKEPEKKEPEKKEPEQKKPLDEKKMSLNAMPLNGLLASAPVIKSKKLLGWEESFVIITGVHRWAEAERAA